MAAPTENKMIYRNLGGSGLKVSAISFGNWLTNDDPKTEATTKEIMKYAFEHGVNFFDTAEIYGFGSAETVFGNILKDLAWDRKDYVLSTKLIWNGGKSPNDSGLSRKHIIEGLTASLERLQHEYVDVVFCHRYDPYTPLEEVVRAMNWCIDHGKALYWATSEWEPDQIERAITIADKLGLARPLADQCQYNLYWRERVELGYSDLFDNYHYGTTVWSPLAGGLLTGKYNTEVPKDARFASLDGPGASNFKKLFGEEQVKETQKALTAFGEIAKELGCSQAALALAWTIRNPDVSTAIVGATKLSQIEDNLNALEILKKITPEINAKIEELFKTAPTPSIDYRKFGLTEPRRERRIRETQN